MKIIPQSFHGFWSSDQNLRVFLWLLIVHVFFLMPFSLLEDTGKFLLSIFFTLLFIAGANAVIQSRRVFILVASVLFLAVFVHWLGWVVEHRTVDILGTATGIVFLLIVIGLLGALVALILPKLTADREEAMGDVCDYNQAGTVRVLSQYADMFG